MVDFLVESSMAGDVYRYRKCDFFLVVSLLIHPKNLSLWKLSQQ